MDTQVTVDFITKNYEHYFNFNDVLVDLMQKGLIDVNYIMTQYTKAIEKNNIQNKIKFHESCLNICQILNGNFKGEDLEKAIKRAIHTYNANETLIPHVLDDIHGYTENDEKTYDELFKQEYGFDIKNK